MYVIRISSLSGLRALVNAKIIEKTNQIKEGSAFCCTEAKCEFQQF